MCTVTCKWTINGRALGVINRVGSAIGFEYVREMLKTHIQMLFYLYSESVMPRDACFHAFFKLFNKEKERDNSKINSIKSYF